MSDFFSAFGKVSKDEWRDKIVADLKGKDPALLEYSDVIEEIEYKAYYHADDISDSLPLPGNYPLTRGLNEPNRRWTNCFFLEVNDESADNKKLLDVLMKGVDGLIIKGNNNTNYSILLDGIGLNHIQTQFYVDSFDHYQSIKKVVGDVESVRFNLDLLQANSNLQEIAESLKEKQQSTFIVNAAAIQQCGANSSQEIAFALNAGHEYLLQLMQAGLSIDDASACIHFHLGVGNDYFIETAKFRTFRTLWSKLVNAYNPAHGCSCNCHITGVVGLSNKSLVDPYTNLLRQTTEAMSALQGGVNSLLVLPYDYNSTKPTELAERMAINISLILKEESYFDKVNDPAGGGYTIETLTTEIGKKAWALFQELESKGGLFNDSCIEYFKEVVSKKRVQRIELYGDQSKTLIGVNKFPAIEPKENNWKSASDYLGMETLILEQEIKTELHEQS